MEKNKFTEEELEDFIRKNKDKFETYPPKENHSDIFLVRLQDRLHKIYISIVPHLIKVAITTVIVFAISLFVWNGWIRKDRDQMSLGSVSWKYWKMERGYKSDIREKDKLLNVFFQATPELKKNFDYNIKCMDSTYVDLKRELKKNPDSELIILSMEYYYLIKIHAYNGLIIKLDSITKINK